MFSAVIRTCERSPDIGEWAAGNALDCLMPAKRLHSPESSESKVNEVEWALAAVKESDLCA